MKKFYLKSQIKQKDRKTTLDTAMFFCMCNTDGQKNRKKEKKERKRERMKERKKERKKLILKNLTE